MRIRPYAPGDRDALHDICLRTGDAGGDATGDYDDPLVIGLVWAAPYAAHEPEHAFVLEDDRGVCGYVLGALDTRAFEATLEREWWPALRRRYPKQVPGRPPAEERTVHLLHDPPRAASAVVAAHPSHLHVDLLPRAQGGGWGRRLVDHECESLAAAGSRGVHLQVSRRNRGAVGFYRHVGFRELTADDHSIVFGRRLRED